MALDRKRIDKSIKKVRKILKKGSGPLSPQDVHDLRTRSRRIEVAIDAARLSAKNNERKVLRNLKRLHKKAGNVRDMDVLTSDLAGVEVKGEEDCRTRLIEYLGARRHKQARKLSRSIREYGEETRRRLNRTSGRFERALDSPGSAKRDAMQSEAAAAALQRSAELTTPHTLNRGNLHSYRVKVKEFRYVLQTAQGAGSSKLIDSLGASKDAIGDWHDWEELIRIVEKVLHHRPCALIEELKKISASKFQAAVAATTRLRHEFIDKGRYDRAAPSRSPSEPTLKAVSAIAS